MEELWPQPKISKPSPPASGDSCTSGSNASSVPNDIPTVPQQGPQTGPLACRVATVNVTCPPWGKENSARRTPTQMLVRLRVFLGEKRWTLSRARSRPRDVLEPRGGSS
jgi:hypothetical protein